jgi:hypothetical protein
MPPDPWEVEGRRLAPVLDSVSAVVVASARSRVAIQHAVGLARVQGMRRRVAIADLVGESELLESQTEGDDPHGLSDSFFYGVSLNKIARPLQGADNVFVMPCGTEPVDVETIYASERWRRLAAGFHQVGALLIVLAKPGTPGFGDLCASVGALLPVGDIAFPVPAGIPLLGPPIAPSSAPAANPNIVMPATSARARTVAEENEGGRRRRLLIIGVVVAAVLVALGALWPTVRPYLPFLGGTPADTAGLVVPPTPMDTVPRTDTSWRDTIPVDSTGALRPAAAAGPAPSAPPPVGNPADSAQAAAFAVFVATANTRANALPEAVLPKASVASLGAVAVSPVPDGAERWFRLTVGAADRRPAAESLLAKMRSDKLLSAGSIVRVPFALRLDQRVEPAVLATRLAALRSRGLLVYALRQSDGSASLYTGAFESPGQAVPLLDSLRATGLAPVLVYRTGRTF